MTWRRVAVLLGVLGLASCGGLSDEKAVRLVEAYNRRVAEAYRTGDPRLIEAVTGPAEGKKLTALIGTKLDMGITLDAELLDFVVLGVQRTRDEVVVSTEERWHYRDRRIGTGEQVGDDSRDSYRMRYLLRKNEDRWVVDEIRFAEPPQVGRKAMPFGADASVMHGVETTVPGQVPGKAGAPAASSSRGAGAPPPAPAGGDER